MFWWLYTIKLLKTFVFQIWDLSDPNGKGFLTKLGFFVALKLVSLAQAGKEISTANITVDAPPPKMVRILCIKYLQLITVCKTNLTVLKAR